jgi:uncharacterized repeat protein (TIGR01451 family)
MAIKMPPEVSFGQEFMYEIDTVAARCVGNVVITDRVPAGATYVRSEPPAEVQGDRLIWRIPEMDATDSRIIKVWLRADQEGRLGSCATVTAEPRACAETLVVRPVLALTKTGPETAQVGNDVPYSIVASNRGSGPVQGVVVTDTVPEGLTHSSGQRQLSVDLGDIMPGQSKSTSVTLHAEQKGRFCNGAVATSSNAGKVNAEACTTVVQPAVKIVKTAAEKEVIINREASYTIDVSNTGDVPLTEVVVVDTAAKETMIVGAEGAASSGNVAKWELGELPPGQHKALNLKVKSGTAGRFCDSAMVTTAQGPRDSSEACTEWLGVTGVLVETVDDPDPIQVGETTTYTIRVTNQGSSRDIQDLVVKSIFAAEIDPVNASSGGTIGGKTVTWPTVPTVGPKQSVTYTVVGKGVKAGDHRMQTQVTTRARQNPITQVESTTVY